MPKEFSASEYWKSRNADREITGVGCRLVTEKINQYMYGRMLFLTRNVVESLIDTSQTILDAGAGIGMLCNYLYECGYTRITAVDISKEALTKVRPEIARIESTIEDMRAVISKTFKLVYCFDVLYHIVNDDDFSRAVRSLCESSEKYVLIQGSFPKFIPIHVFKHVWLRTLAAHDREFNKHGFVRVRQVPTWFIMGRFPFYFLLGLAPKFLDRIDSWLLQLARVVGLSTFSSHNILIYEKKE